jgi:hypothetical protein
MNFAADRVCHSAELPRRRPGAFAHFNRLSVPQMNIVPLKGEPKLTLVKGAKEVCATERTGVD